MIGYKIHWKKYIPLIIAMSMMVNVSGCGTISNAKDSSKEFFKKVFFISTEDHPQYQREYNDRRIPRLQKTPVYKDSDYLKNTQNSYYYYYQAPIAQENYPFTAY